MLILIAIIVLIMVIMIKALKNPKDVKSQNAPAPERKELSDAEREAMRQAEEVWDMKTVLAIQFGHYEGPLPDHIVGGHWTDLYPNIYRTKIAGINFRKDAKTYAGQIIDCMLYPDPKNDYDPNAIKVVTNDYTHIGFIPADETQYIREWVNNQLPYPCRARIQEQTDYDYDDRERTYLTGNICINKPNK